MRMSHIYQPVMLRQLLISGGTASRESIARAILEHDPSQVEYYEQVVQNMVGRVLTSKDDLVRRDGREYQLVAAPDLRQEEREELIAICDGQIARYLAARASCLGTSSSPRSRPIRKPQIRSPEEGALSL